MGFKWYTTSTDDTINWDTVAKSFDKYFEKLGTEGCCIELDGEIFVINVKDIKFPNEDNWEELE